MESKLLKGARSIEDYTSEQEKALRQHQLDVVAQQRREEYGVLVLFVLFMTDDVGFAESFDADYKRRRMRGWVHRSTLIRCNRRSMSKQSSSRNCGPKCRPLECKRSRCTKNAQTSAMNSRRQRLVGWLSFGIVSRLMSCEQDVLQRELKLRLLMIEHFIPPEDVAKVEAVWFYK